jgi:AraC-like DNA-binding protein
MSLSIPQRTRIFQRDDALGRWMVATCQPHGLLSAWVDSYWYGQGQVNYRRDRILPNATSFLLINLGLPQYRIEAGPPERRVPFRDIWYSGMQQAPIETEAPQGSALLGVAFKSIGARPILGGDAGNFVGRVVPLADMLGDGALALRERLLNIKSISARFAALERWLQDRFSPRLAPHALSSWAVAELARSAGQIDVQVLARQAGVSRKYLTNLFRRDVGLAPKAVARVQRFQASLRLLAGREQVPWVRLAAHCGYYDQAHLTRDFKLFSGFTPGEFVRMGRPDAISVVVE